MIIDLINSLKTDWKVILLDIITKLENTNCIDNINEILLNETEKIIYPTNNLILNTFNHFNIEDIKVIIIGQDPYHTPNKAMGLSFSVPNGESLPPSLRNIFKELKDDEYLIPKDKKGDLTKWVKQGVLLLNSSLTVIEKTPNSHQKIWSPFTDKIIEYISNNSDGIVFMLWGNFAKNKKKYINLDKHYILESSHPSPMSANRGGWFGTKHFRKANEYLISNSKNPIDWNLQ